MLRHLRDKFMRKPETALRQRSPIVHGPQDLAAEGLELAFDIERMRERLMTELTELTEQYMRSPTFLAWLRYSLMTITEFQLLWSGKYRRAGQRQRA
jgi:hypothetical protein